MCSLHFAVFKSLRVIWQQFHVYNRHFICKSKPSWVIELTHFHLFYCEWQETAQIRMNSDKTGILPLPPRFSNLNPGSSWGPTCLGLYYPFGLIKLPGLGCSMQTYTHTHTHTPPTMSLLTPSTSVESAYVRWGTGCLMVVSCMPLGVEITKAGSFSPPHSAATF